MALLFTILFIVALGQLGGIFGRSRRLLEACEGLKRANQALQQQLQTLSDQVTRIEGAIGDGRGTAPTADEPGVAPVVQTDA